MATNLVYRNDDKNNRVETLAATHAPGVPVIDLEGNPAVTLTGSGDYTITDATNTPYTISGIPAGGVGLTGKQVTLCSDGTWEFIATDFGNTAPNPLTIAQAVSINFVTATGKLTTTAVGAGIVAYGYVDVPPDYDRTRGLVPVRIGA